MFDQNLAHQLRGDAIEVRPTLPLRKNLSPESQVSFVNESGGLQRVTGSFGSEVAIGDLAQILVDDRYQLFQGVPVALTPIVQQSRNVVRYKCLHEPSFQDGDI